MGYWIAKIVGMGLMSLWLITQSLFASTPVLDPKLSTQSIGEFPDYVLDPSEDPEVRDLQKNFQNILSEIFHNIELIDAGVEKASFTVKEVKVLSGVERATPEYFTLSDIWRVSLERLREILPPEQFVRVQVRGYEGVEGQILSNIFILKCAMEMLVIKLIEHDGDHFVIENIFSPTEGWSLCCKSNKFYNLAFLNSLEVNLDNLLNMGQLRAKIQPHVHGFEVKINSRVTDSASLVEEKVEFQKAS